MLQAFPHTFPEKQRCFGKDRGVLGKIEALLGKSHVSWKNGNLVNNMVNAPSGRVGASHQLLFLLARRLHNALLSPISFCHRLQPFLYYFHNSLEIKSFFPLNLFQKCFPANYTCCVCRKTFCKQLQFGIVCKPSIIESRLNRII